MNLLCWLFGHRWEIKWITAAWSPWHWRVIICARCGAERQCDER